MKDKIEVFRTTRWPGHMAILWQKGQVIRVFFKRDYYDALAAAELWREPVTVRKEQHHEHAR